jgi:sialidase-1
MRQSILKITLVGAILLTLSTAVQADPFFHKKDLFISGNDDVNIYRIPILLVTPKGTLLAFCEARDGDDGDPTDSVVKRSRFNGNSGDSNKLNGQSRTFGYGFNWEPMQVVLPGKGKAIMQNTPVIDHSTGTIFLCCYEVTGGLKQHLKTPYAGRTLLLQSNDDGKTWSTPRDLTPNFPNFIAGPSIGIQLKSGRLIIPGYSKESRYSGSRVMYSDDHGKTWKLGAQVKGHTNESQAVELSDGSLMLNSRYETSAKCRYVALSRDGGETWYKEFEDKNLPDPRCQACLMRLPTKNRDGKNQLLFSNPFNAKSLNRSNMTVKLSNDEGKSWKISRTIFSGPAAYSCMAVLADGNIGLLYESGDKHPYQKITFARFNLEWLTSKQ